MTEIVGRVADALTEAFKDRISQHADVPFHETGVAIPHRDIWLNYASTAINACRSTSQRALLLLEEVKLGDNDMVTAETLVLAAELISGGLCTLYEGHDGQLYLQACE